MQAPIALVQPMILVPVAMPVNAVMLCVGAAIVAVPEITDQEPVPIEMLFPVTVVELVEAHRLWLGPATGAVGDVNIVIVTVFEF